MAPEPDAINGFPLAVGSKWTYAIYDSVAMRADTVEVTIDNKIVTSLTRTVYLWRYQYRTHADSLYVVPSGDTVLFYRTSKFQYVPIMFVFPLAVGHGWRRPSADTFYVAAKESTLTPAGTFANSFRIFQQPFEGNFYGGTTYWLAPDVGMVRKRERWHVTIGDEFVDITWQLLSFSFPS